MKEHRFYCNPHLDGKTFLWEGGPVGVLLSHGFKATTAEVQPLAHLLVRQGFTVGGLLLPGHGTSIEEINRCRWQDWAAAVEDFYQLMAGRCRQVFVGGESMGSLLTLYLAAHHPEIAGVLAYAPALRLPSRWKPLLAPLLAAFVPYQEIPLGPATPVDDLWQGYTVNPVPAAAQLFQLQRVVRKLLPRIKQPLLIVQGKLDTSIDINGAKVIYQEVSSSKKELHWMEKSTHCVILDREIDIVAEITLRFLTNNTISFD